MNKHQKQDNEVWGKKYFLQFTYYSYLCCQSEGLSQSEQIKRPLFDFDLTQ